MERRVDPFPFPTAPDGETDAFYKELLAGIADRLEEELGGRVDYALVLSGSLALGEGSAFRDGSGRLVPGSDIDLYLVTAENGLPALKRALPAVQGRVLEGIALPGLVVDLGATSPERLGSLTPTVANCLLLSEGKVVRGDPALFRGAAPPYREIPPWDGLLLLLNRTAEELAELRIRPRGEEESAMFWYRFGKTVRDLGTSALVIAGRFRPRLPERRGELPGVLEERGIAERLPGYLDDFEFWCGQKNRPTVEEARRRYGEGDEGIRAAQTKKREYLEVFWTWGSDEAFSPGGGGFEPARRRVRLWLRFLCARGPAALGATLGHLSRGLPASPLVANYAAAVRLLLAWGPVTGARETGREEEDLEEARRLAPVGASGRGDFRRRWTALRDSVCRFWDREVMGGTRPPHPLEKS